MAKPTPMFEQKPMSLAHMRSVFAGTDPRKLAALCASMPWDYFVKTYDFESPTMTSDWSTAVTAGGAPTAFAYNGIRNAAARGATGTTDDGVTAIYYHAAVFDAADNPLMIARLKMPAAVSAFVMEIGFSDPKTDEKLVSVSDVDTPAVANGITDAVIFNYDDEQTLDAGLVGVGTSTTILATTVYSVGTTVWTPTASKWVDIMVGCRAGQGYMSLWQDGAPIGNRQWAVASGPDAGVLMRPSLVFKTTNTTTKQIDIDYITLIAERNNTA